MYEEAATQFELLLKKFPVENRESTLQQYQKCIDNITTLISLETNSQFVELLKTVQCNIQWQCHRIHDEVPTVEDCHNERVNEFPNKRSATVWNASNEKMRQEVIKSTLQCTYGNGLKDIAGLVNVKSELRKCILLPLQFPNLYTGGRKPSRHVLLYGPPGNGKSRIAAALAHEAKVQFYNISSADILSSWVGESEKMIKTVFEYIRTLSKDCIVFVDEIDSFCRKRTDKEADYSRRIKNQLLIELDRNINNPNSKCVVLCATNCPWDIDSAFMRRFQGRIFVPLPDRETRLQLIKLKSHDVGMEMSHADWETIVNRTEGYSGSDLTNVVSYAIQEPIVELDKSKHWLLTKELKWTPCLAETAGSISASLTTIPSDKVSIRNVRLQDFAKAVLVIQRTVSSTDLKKYII